MGIWEPQDAPSPRSHCWHRTPRTALQVDVWLHPHIPKLLLFTPVPKHQHHNPPPPPSCTSHPSTEAQQGSSGLSAAPPALGVNTGKEILAVPSQHRLPSRQHRLHSPVLPALPCSVVTPSPAQPMRNLGGGEAQQGPLPTSQTPHPHPLRLGTEIHGAAGRAPEPSSPPHSLPHILTAALSAAKP